MNQSNNGEIGYTDSKISEFVKKLDSQVEAFNLNSVIIDTDVPMYLNVTDEHLYKMTPEELRIAELKICAFAFSLQKYINRATAIKNYASKLLGMVVASKHKDYSTYTKYEVIEKDVIRRDVYAQRIDEIIQEQQLKIDEFFFLSQSLTKVAESFGKLAGSRSRKDVN